IQSIPGNSSVHIAPVSRRKKMSRTSRLSGSVLAVFVIVACAAISQAGDEMVEHPWYKHWASFKPGSTVTLVEKTTFSGPEQDQSPDGIDEKVVTRKLLSVTPEAVVVQTVVTERDFLGLIESAPTKTTYAAKIKKSPLDTVLHHFDSKAGTAELEFDGK